MDHLQSFEEDKFKRKQIAQNLTKILTIYNKPLVISLDSEWGTGKTTFVTMWKNMLDKDTNYSGEFETFYFNAWENDYIKDPITAFFSDFELQLQETDSKVKKVMRKMKVGYKCFVQPLSAQALKGVTGIDCEIFNGKNYNEVHLIELADKIGDITTQEISLQRTIRAEFKQTMADYQKNNGKKIVFFIDELDRCRPNFAIELLEVIKHLFDVENFIFIISIDKEQLSHAIATIYGQKMDTIGYLRRFFDFDYQLPKINIENYLEVKSSFFGLHRNTQFFEYFLKELFIQDKFSLRDIDKTYDYLEIVIPLLSLYNDQEMKRGDEMKLLATSYLHAVLIAIKVKNPSLYRKIVEVKYESNEMINYPMPNFQNFSGELGDFDGDDIQKIAIDTWEKFLNMNWVIKNSEQEILNYNEAYIVSTKGNANIRANYADLNLREFFDGKKNKITAWLDFVDGFYF